MRLVSWCPDWVLYILVFLLLVALSGLAAWIMALLMGTFALFFGFWAGFLVCCVFGFIVFGGIG